MATPLWDEKKIQAQVLAKAMNLIPFTDALETLYQMQSEYESERLLTQTQLAQQQSRIDALEAQLQGYLATTTDVQVSVDKSVPLLTTSFSTSVAMIENPPLWSLPSWGTIRESLAQCCDVFKYHIFPFGLIDPWLEGESEPNFQRGQGLGNAFSRFREIQAYNPQAKILLTLYGAPWWMKSVMFKGVSTPLTSADAYSDDGRVTQGALPRWLTLVDKAVRLAVAYGCTDFEIWNEVKGWYATPNNQARTWDARYAPGTGVNGDMGFSYFHEQTANRVVQTMTALGFSRNQYRIAAPYIPMPTRGSANADSIPSTHPLYAFREKWGYMNIQPVKFLVEFFQQVALHKLPLDMIALDLSAGTTDGVYPNLNPFNYSSKLADIVQYARNELNLAGLPESLPFIISEHYEPPPGELDNSDSEPLRSAMWADAMRVSMLSGVLYTVPWGASSPVQGKYPQLSALINKTTGELRMTGRVFSLFKKHFPPGTKLVKTVMAGKDFQTLASAEWTMLFNQSGQPRKVLVGTKIYDMLPYETSVVGTE
jgi:hypothetical protein